jgi:hypothetical protein
LKNLSKENCEALCTWRGGVTQDVFLEKSKRYFREHIFSPLKIFWARDLFEGILLNFQSLQVIHKIESNGKRAFNCMFPST